MKKLLILLGVVGAAVITVSASSGVQAESAAAEAASEAASEAAAQVTLLSRAQTAADRLPSFITPDDEVGSTIVAESTRLLGASATGTHWVGTNAKGEACLVTALGSAETDFVAAASCIPADELATESVGLQVMGPTGKSEAYLLPDGVHTAALATAGYSVVSPNLVSADPAAPLAGDRTVARGAGQITLPDLAPSE